MNGRKGEKARKILRAAAGFPAKDNRPAVAEEFRKGSEMRGLRIILLAATVASLGVLFSTTPRGAGSAVTEARERATITEVVAPEATLTSLQEGFVDNLNSGKYGTIQDEGDVVGFSAEGTVVAESPGFWRALGKGMIVAGSGLIGLGLGGGPGCAIGLAASAVFVTELNREGSVVQDMFLYTDITVEGQGNILPDVIAVASMNITDTVSLEDAFGAGSSMSFVDPGVFSVRVVDENLDQVTSIAGYDTFLFTDPEDVTVFGVVIYNDPEASGRPIEFSDQLDIDLGALITAPDGTLVSYEGTAIFGNERLTHASPECVLEDGVGGIAEATDLDASALGATDSGGSSGTSYAVVVGIAAGAVLLGAGGWYARRRRQAG